MFINNGMISVMFIIVLIIFMVVMICFVMDFLAFSIFAMIIWLKMRLRFWQVYFFFIIFFLLRRLIDLFLIYPNCVSIFICFVEITEVRMIVNRLKGRRFELLMGIAIWIGWEFQVRLELFVVIFFGFFSILNLRAIFRLRGSYFMMILIFFVLLSPNWSLLYSLLRHLFF